jgi:hypothetical protein
MPPETGAGDPNITYGYCAQVADVEVDLDTGHVTVKRLISVNDVGKAVNPQLIEGQIEGAVAQSVGWTLLEDYIQRTGAPLTPHLSTYLIPGVLDVVEEIEPVILENPRSARAAGCARHGRDALHPHRTGDWRRHLRSNRRLARRTALHAGTGVAALQPASGFTMRPGTWFETYLDDPSVTPTDQLRTEICLPIE